MDRGTGADPALVGPPFADLGSFTAGRLRPLLDGVGRLPGEGPAANRELREVATEMVS